MAQTEPSLNGVKIMQFSLPLKKEPSCSGAKITPKFCANMTEDFSPKALVVVERLRKVASLLLNFLKLVDLIH